MTLRLDQLDPPLARLDHLLAGVTLSASMKAGVERWRSDAAALRFHLRPRDQGKPLLLAVIGGTGTGKSTLVNRLLGVDASATSFRRTFTAGPVAISREPADVPAGWLGVEHVLATPDRLPARGENGTLVVIPRSALGPQSPHETLLSRAVLIDTPDLDGDQPVHHAQADRAFRWAQAILFLVTPEKYQMTELLPYYRLAVRYALPTLFVMNKCEEQAVAEDYRGQVAEHLGNGKGDLAGVGAASHSPAPSTAPGQVPLIFVIPRDDAAYDAPAGENLPALRDMISQLTLEPSSVQTGLCRRGGDLAGRFEDQVLSPFREERREVDRLVDAIRDMETPAPGVDVNPVTQDLQRRLQQRSVLYLMGPQRVLERVRQAPLMLLRLPRVAWDYVMRGEVAAGAAPGDGNAARDVPDFKIVLRDQFSVLQSRIDDLLRTSPTAQKWVAAGGKAYEQARLAPENAGRIAEEELADLRAWLENRWNATPRDTKAVHALLKYVPGGKKLTALAESAPYLLALALIAHHALFGTDLLVLGGYTIATWLTERLSNEVAARTRAANDRIADRFTRLAHEQIQKICAWLNQQAVAAKLLDQLENAASDLARAAGLEKSE